MNYFFCKNNCGKTTLLESIFILSGMSNPELPLKCNQFRDFENLLEKIVQPEHNCILEYFKEYEQKLESCKDSEGLCKYNTPDQKARIYAYAVAVKKHSNTENESFKKGCWSFTDSKYWNLESDYIRPLKDFLKKAFE